MAQLHDSMMNPPIEDLLGKVDSKFRLVTLGAMRARQINSYFGQLGEGLGATVPPQVTSVARKPLSIAFEEIAADKIVAVDAEPEADVEARRGRRGRRREPPSSAVPPDASLAGRTIVLGVTGGIAAYKAIEVCRRLVDAGAHVAPVLTEGAAALRRRHHLLGAGLRAGADVAVRRARPDPAHPARPEGRPRSLVCPATARLLGSYAAGISDDLLTATLLATRAPVIVCPAMHTEMWEHPAVQDNLATLRRAGRASSCRPRPGAWPAATSAPAAWPSPTPSSPPSSGCSRPATSPALRVLVTAGGTREPIDPGAGHHQPLVGQAGLRPGRRGRRPRAPRSRWSPPSTARCRPASTSCRVETRRRDAGGRSCRSRADQDVIIMAAAVADFRLADVADHKIKKGATAPCPRSCSSPPTTSSSTSARDKPAGQVLVGFAAETDDVLANAARQARAQEPRPHRRQRRRAPPASGFEHDTNEVVILDRDGGQRRVALADKRAVAAPCSTQSWPSRRTAGARSRPSVNYRAGSCTRPSSCLT